jgi:RNA-directed DNA polymerase
MGLTPPVKVQELQESLHAKARGASNYRFYALYDKVYRTGRPHPGVSPSQKRMQRICVRVSERTDRRTTSRSGAEGVADLNRLAEGWANYFCLGSVSKAYRIVEEHLRYRLRQGLNRRHKVRLGVHHLEDAERETLGLIRRIGRKGCLPWANA